MTLGALNCELNSLSLGLYVRWVCDFVICRLLADSTDYHACIFLFVYVCVRACLSMAQIQII